MKKLILFFAIIFSLFDSISQERLILRYKGYQFYSTKNNSFTCKKMLFENIIRNDTLSINVRLPIKFTTKKRLSIKKWAICCRKDTIAANIINPGIYYNCHLQEDSIYTITLKKICVNDIPDFEHSYYKINAIFEKANCSKFTEIEKKTDYTYQGNYGKYVDINGILYEVIGLTPNVGCFFPH